MHLVTQTVHTIARGGEKNKRHSEIWGGGQLRGETIDLKGGMKSREDKYKRGRMPI